VIDLADRTGVPGAVIIVLLVAGVVVATAGFGFAVALEDVMEGNGVIGADPAVQRFLVRNRSGALTELFRGLTHLGSAVVVIPIALVVLALLMWRRMRLPAFGLVLAVSGAAVLVAVVKALVGRDRPPPIDRLSAATGSSFPSGHSAISIAFYGALAWVVVASTPRRGLRLLACGAALGLGLLVGFSRAYLGVHWMSDVVSGWLLGLAWLAITIVVCALIDSLPKASEPEEPEEPREPNGPKKDERTRGIA
jgi:membrane-associated phospholipid phosphatase